MKPPTFIECTVCGREFGSKSIAIHERQCLQKLRRTEICQDGDSTVQGKGRNKKRAPSVSPVPRTAFQEKQDRPPPWEQSPQQILLPKIQTDYGKKGRKNQELIRPTTATLSKPKFLNPEYIRHDMSLTRIDYSTAQLRINDDENHNLRYNRHNIVFPSVNPIRGHKSKHQSPHKSDNATNNGRGVVKLPESTKSTLPGDSSKKQNGAESSSSVGVVLPSNSEMRMLDPFCSAVNKSQSFPLLYSSDFVMKRMKANEIPFPRIPNDRIPNQSNPNYFLTPTSRLPRWDDEEGCHVLGEDDHHPGSFFPNSQYPDEEAQEPPTTSTEELEFIHQGHGISVPEVILVREDMDSFDTPSEESFGTFEPNPSYQTLITRVIGFSSANLNASMQGRGIMPELDWIEDDGCKGEGVKIQDLGQSENARRVGSLSCASVDPVSSARDAPFCSDYACRGARGPGDWLFCNPKSWNPSVTMISTSSDENPPEFFQSPRGNDASSGSDCDNEGTSSGYGLLRPTTSRTILNKRKKRQTRKSRPTFSEGFREQPISCSILPPHSTDDFTNTKLVNISQKIKRASHEKKLRSRISMITSRDKVNEWLEACAIVSRDDEIDKEITGNGDGERLMEKLSEKRSATREKEIPNPETVTLSENFIPAFGEDGTNRQSPEKTVSGLVTVTFKVKEGNETRTYNFFNKSKMKGPSPPVKLMRSGKSTSAAVSMLPKNSDLFRSYAPTKCLRADKQVVKMLKKLESLVSFQRPRTTPSMKLRDFPTQLDCQKLRRPQTTTAANKLDSGNFVNSPFSQKKSGSQRYRGKTSASASYTKGCVMVTLKTLPIPAHLSNSCTTPQTSHDTPKGLSLRNLERQCDHVKPRLRPSTPFIPRRRWSTQNSTLLFAGTTQKLDKSSQAPETRSTCVQFPTFAPL